MQITPLDPITAPAQDLAAWHEVLCAARRHDLPDDPLLTAADVTALLKNRSSNADWLHWIARVDWAPAAICTLRLEDEPNDEWGEVDLTVAPAFRRRGIGRTLLAEALRQLVVAGRPTINAEVPDGTPGVPFADAHGFAIAMTDQRGILRTADPQAGDLDSWAQVPPGYRLLRWPGHVPDEFIESYVTAKKAMADAPTGELKWRPRTFDAAKWREVEETYDRRGQQLNMVVAVHEASAAVAALTELSYWADNPQRAMQSDTLVVPQHRGHRLGLAVKAGMLRWLRADSPQVGDIETWNSDDNAHMLAINDRLGSRRERLWYQYQTEVATALERCSHPINFAR